MHLYWLGVLGLCIFTDWVFWDCASLLIGCSSIVHLYWLGVLALCIFIELGGGDDAGHGVWSQKHVNCCRHHQHHPYLLSSPLSSLGLQFESWSQTVSMLREAMFPVRVYHEYIMMFSFSATTNPPPPPPTPPTHTHTQTPVSLYCFIMLYFSLRPPRPSPLTCWWSISCICTTNTICFFPLSFALI